MTPAKASSAGKRSRAVEPVVPLAFPQKDSLLGGSSHFKWVLKPGFFNGPRNGAPWKN